VHPVLTTGDTRRAAFLEAVSELQLGRYSEAWNGFSTLHRDRADAALANDMGVVQLRRPGNGPKATVYGVHGATAVVLLATAALLFT